MAEKIAVDTTYAEVKAAYDLCAEGDTLTVPAGSSTWATTLAVTKHIYIVGAGVGSTNITCGVAGSFCITYNPADYDSDLPFRLTGFTFDANGNFILKLGTTKSGPFGLQTKVRIDHNRFTNSGAQVGMQGIWSYGTLYGVVDNNTFDGMDSPIGHTNGVNKDGWWGNSPQNIFAHGSPNYLYYEDNAIACGGGSIQVSRGEYSARYVFRYNDITPVGEPQPLFDLHGQQGNAVDSMASCFGAELYGNDIDLGTDGMTFFKTRSGQSLVFLNNTTSSGSVANSAYTSALCVLPDAYVAGKVTHNTYFWGSRKNLTGDLWGASCDHTLGLDWGGVTGIPTLGRDVISDGSTPAITMGPLASLPATCAVGQGYWATAQATDDLTGLVGVAPATPIAGTLYRCDETNVWTKVYTPYTYPHPLRGEVGTTYRVLYYGNGNLTGAAPVDETGYATSASVTILGQSTLARESYYAFVGWNTQADGLGTTYAPGATMVMGAADVTLYAVWRVKCALVAG